MFGGGGVALMIRLRPEVASRVAGGLDDLKAVLQSAIELEHATLPPYLYALYSIRPGSNERLAAIIRSVAMEEMLHLALCCNLLNAIGGAPALDKPDFIPVYPGPLPGAVTGIEVPLAAVSKPLLRDVFMKIEEPEEPLEFPVGRLAFADRAAPSTIGQFYQAIKVQFARLAAGGDIFVGPPARQLVSGLPSLIRVTDLQSANRAIDLIVKQGEGTPASPLNPADAPAHYYLFEAAFKGRELVPQPGVPPFAFAGDPIPFDQGGIVRLATNPTPKRYQGTPAAGPNEQFNKTYTRLLQALHRTFNGSPINIFGSINLMRQLAGHARELARIEFEPGVFAGPTFTYTPDATDAPPFHPTGGDEMASFQQVQDVLENVLGGTLQPFHMPFWRVTRDEMVAKKLLGQPLIVVGHPEKSVLFLVLRDGARGPLRAYFGDARAAVGDLAVIEQWIRTGCPEVAARSGPARESLADVTEAAEDDQHTAYWRAMDVVFHPAVATQPTKGHVLLIHGVSLEEWVPTMLTGADLNRWPNYLALADVAESMAHVRHHQRRLLQEYYAGAQADVLDTHWKFGGSLLPIDPTHPLKPQMGVIHHRMNGLLDWFFWVPYIDFTLRAPDVQTIDLDLARGWQVGIVADGLLRTDNERPVGQRMPIPDFTAGDPNLRANTMAKYAGMGAAGLIEEMVRRAKQARDAGIVQT